MEQQLRLWRDCVDLKLTAYTAYEKKISSDSQGDNNKWGKKYRIYIVSDEIIYILVVWEPTSNWRCIDNICNNIGLMMGGFEYPCIIIM